MPSVIPKIKRRVYIKDERVHDINQTNALNAVRRYLEEQKQSFLVALDARKAASATAVSDQIESIISDWQSGFEGNVETIRDGIINYLTADTAPASVTDDTDVGTNSWTSYNSLATDVANSFYDYLKSSYSGVEGEDAINIFKTFDATLSNYASKTVVDALDEFAKVMDSAFVFGEDYPGYVTDTTYGIQFEDYSDYTVLTTKTTSNETSISNATSDIFFSDEANVYYKRADTSNHRIYLGPSYNTEEYERGYYYEKASLVSWGGKYSSDDVLRYKHKLTDPDWLTINHDLSWPVPTNFQVSPVAASLSGIKYCRGNDEPTAVYYSGQAEIYAVKVDGKYKRLFRWDANSSGGVAQTKALVSTLRNNPKLNFYQAIYGTFDSAGTLNANEYDVSFYYDNDDLVWMDSNLVIKDWCPIYKGTIRYANTSSTIKSNTVDGVVKYYTKVTTTYQTVSYDAETEEASIVDTTGTFVCVLLDDSTSRPIIRNSLAPALTKEGVLGTLAIYYDQQDAAESVSVATFDGWSTLN